MQARDGYPHLADIPTRWNDNDVYGHVNNVEYYAYFDTVINRWLIEQGGEPAATGSFVHVFVERVSRRPVEIPAPIRAALERLQPATEQPS